MICRRLYACCEPIPDDFDDNSPSPCPSPKDGEDACYDDCFVCGFEPLPTHKRRNQERYPSGRMTIKTKPSFRDEDLRERQSMSVDNDGELISSPSTHHTAVMSPVIKHDSTDCNTEIEPPPAGDAPKPWSAPNGEAPRRRPSDVPPRPPDRCRRWPDEVLEGFLYSTLVDGSGLVLDKLDSNGKGKKIGERTLSFDPHALALKWISKGIRRKIKSIPAKDIDRVTCEGTSITILYSKVASTVPGVIRTRSLSPLRRSSLLPPNTPVMKVMVLRASEERDALILKEVLLFVRRKARTAFSAAVFKSHGTAVHSSGASASSSACGSASIVDSEDDTTQGASAASTSNSDQHHISKKVAHLNPPASGGASVSDALSTTSVTRTRSFRRRFSLR